jgi:hypothetical protein
MSPTPFPAATFAFPWQLPLSGDVTQAINPWTWMNHGLAQAGFVNINIGAAGNPAAEQAIVQNVASYGRQLGILMQVIDLLLAKAEDAAFTSGEQETLAQYHALCVGVAAAKVTAGSTLDAADVARLQTHLAKAPKDVRESQPWQDLLASLQNAAYS